VTAYAENKQRAILGLRKTFAPEIVAKPRAYQNAVQTTSRTHLVEIEQALGLAE
jgi:hypothetical protein